MRQYIAEDWLSWGQRLEQTFCRNRDDKDCNIERFVYHNCGDSPAMVVCRWSTH